MRKIASLLTASVWIPRLVRSLLLALVLAPMLAQAAPVTPRTYGAVGDGVANEATALQSALNTGKVVHLEGGTYRITQRVNIPAGGGIVGPGTIVHDFNLTLPPADPNGLDVALYIAGDNVTLSEFTLRKNFTDGSYATGIVADHRKNIILRNLDISGYSARYGLHIIESTDFEIVGCHIHDFMVNTTADMIQDSPAGLRVTRSQRGIIAGNRIVDIEVGPIGLESISPQRPTYGKQGYQSDCMTLMQCQQVVIQGNTCITSGEGIDVLLSGDCVISGNNIQGIYGQGIKMLGVSYSAVSGNFIKDAYQGIGLTYHPSVLAEASGNAITGNVLRNIGALATVVNWGGLGAGIDLHDANQCRFNVVANNVAVDTQTTKTATSVVRNIGGATNVVDGNVFTLGITQP